MPRLQSYVKKVACLEGEWSGWQDKSSVIPILHLIKSQIKGFDYFYRRLSSEEEMVSSVQKIGRSKSYSLIYLAFHGTPGAMETDMVEWNLADLAELVGRKFAGRVIHFGSCSTLREVEDEILDFIDKTGVAMVTGYTKDVGWIESSAFELLYFSAWQDYVNTGAFVNRIQTDYGDLVERLGFVAFARP